MLSCRLMRHSCGVDVLERPVAYRGVHGLTLYRATCRHMYRAWRGSVAGSRRGLCDCLCVVVWRVGCCLSFRWLAACTVLVGYASWRFELMVSLRLSAYIIVPTGVFS